MQFKRYISHSDKKIEKVIRKLLDLHPKSIDLSLGRIKKILLKLGNPQNKISNYIQVAGTNGKGSTSTILYNLQKAMGRKVHVYRSPHLLKLNERVIIANKQISNKYLLQILEEVYFVNAGEKITFFEILTAAAFLAFSRSSADLVILEVGLGGRFDATNIIKKNLTSIITTIGNDHKEFLGSDLSAIAREKAGIIKTNGKLIISKQKTIVNNILKEIAYDKNCKTYIYQKDWRVKGSNLYFKKNIINLKELSLEGRHQYINTSCAIISCLINKELHFNLDLLDDTIKRITWQGRLQRVQGNLAKQYSSLKLWLDVAHNPLAFNILKDWIIKKGIKNPIFIMAIGLNKDYIKIIQNLKKANPYLVLLPKGLKLNAHDPNKIKKKCDALKIKCLVSENLDSALKECEVSIGKRKNNNQVIITGSFAIVSEAISIDK